LNKTWMRGAVKSGVSIRKLNLSSSIVVVLQASQTAVVFYNFQVQLLAVLQNFSGFNCHLPTIKFNY
jgi:hypothetical protein